MKDFTKCMKKFLSPSIKFSPTAYPCRLFYAYGTNQPFNNQSRFFQTIIFPYKMYLLNSNLLFNEKKRENFCLIWPHLWLSIN
jgi:hypothetical protein